MSNESITNKVQSYPPLAKVLPTLITQIFVAMAIAGAFAGLYIGLQNDPTPHDIPIAVAGSELAEASADAAGSAVSIREVDSREEGEQLVRDHAALGVLSADASGFTLGVASANGRSVTSAVTTIATRIADGAGAQLATHDLVPLTQSDPQGLSGFYLVFGTTLAGFILAQVMSALAPLARLRVRVTITVIGSFAAASLAAIIAGPIYGAIPANTATMIFTLGLLATAVSLSSLAITTLIGPMGTIVSTLLFTTLGNATSGATISAYLMPSFFGAIGAVLPPGAAFRAVTILSYFDASQATVPLATLVAWIAVASAVLTVTHALRRRRGLCAAPTEALGSRLFDGGTP